MSVARAINLASVCVSLVAIILSLIALWRSK